jgi:uncharacterized Zn finger protein
LPGRESAADKGRRLLAEGRLTVTLVDSSEPDPLEVPAPIIATCRGDSGEVYNLGYDARKKQWRCTCVEMKGKCSHLVALQLVTIRPGGDQ